MTTADPKPRSAIDGGSRYQEIMLDYTKLPDRDLIERCLIDDAGAWEALVRRYQNLIISIAVKFGILDEADDIVQTVCLALLQQMSSLRKEAKLSSWLITVTVRECWKFRRRGGKTHLMEQEEWDRIADTPDREEARIVDFLIAEERRLAIRRSVEQLPSPCRELLEQLFYQDTPASYGEIGHRLKMPVASIGPIRARCLAKLKRELQKK